MNEEQTSMWYEQRVEAFIDGELPGNEARMFAARLEIDQQLKQSVEAAMALQGVLGAIPISKCPASVSHNVFEATGTRWQINWNPGWNWAAAATAAVLVIAVNFSLIYPGSPDPLEPTQAELKQARQDLAVALVYLGRASNTASREIGRQMINEGFVRPVSHGLQQTLPANRSLLPIDMEDAS